MQEKVDAEALASRRRRQHACLVRSKRACAESALVRLRLVRPERLVDLDPDASCWAKAGASRELPSARP